MTNFPQDPAAPVRMGFEGVSVEVLVAKRAALKIKEDVSLSSWAVAGAYVLLGPPTPEAVAGATIRARPGSTSDLIDRLNRHLEDDQMEWFDRAVLIRGLPPRGLDVAKALHLEGLLHDLCKNSARVESPFRRDGSSGLAPHQQQEIERYLLPIVRGVLELVGVPTETVAELTAGQESSLRRRPITGANP